MEPFISASIIGRTEKNNTIQCLMQSLACAQVLRYVSYCFLVQWKYLAVLIGKGWVCISEELLKCETVHQSSFVYCGSG